MKVRIKNRVINFQVTWLTLFSDRPSDLGRPDYFFNQSRLLVEICYSVVDLIRPHANCAQKLLWRNAPCERIVNCTFTALWHLDTVGTVPKSDKSDSESMLRWFRSGARYPRRKLLIEHTIALFA